VAKKIGVSMGIEVINPYNQEVLARLPHDSENSASQKIDALHAAYLIWRESALQTRVEVVEKVLAYFAAEAEMIAQEITLQMGKPLKEAQGEVQTFLERGQTMCKLAPSALAPLRPERKDGFERRIEHVPMGVVFNIVAWNYPLLLPVNVVVPAILAGNTVLFKHSGVTALTAKRFKEAFAFAGQPDLLHEVQLTHDMTSAIIQDERIEHVSFTGSVHGGHEIYRAVAKQRFIDCGLELGGKDPAYIAEDADLTFALPNIVEGACYNAGQSCCAIERVYVHDKHYDAFITGAKEALSAYVLGDPLLHETTMGPLARRSALGTLHEHVDDAGARGAAIFSAHELSGTQKESFFAPTLIADAPQDALVMQDESFGPLLPVHRVKDDAEALDKMNDSAFGLTASVWTKDVERAEHFGRDLKTGTIFQNRCDYLDPALAWTGIGDSGKGSTLSAYGFHHLTRRKSLHFRTGR
jgi:acyl-CoA reductase-like NAD-dependent aldehyde dehydrogenase